MRGRYDEAARELSEHAPHRLGDTRDVQFTLPLRCTAATDRAPASATIAAARQTV